MRGDVLDMEYHMRSIESINRRRKQVQRQRIVIFTMIAIFIMILSIIFGSRLTYADEQNHNMTPQKYFKSITIQTGDTLTTIAEEFMGSEYQSTSQYIQEVKSLNCMLDDDIASGDHLIVPYYGYSIEVAVY